MNILFTIFPYVELLAGVIILCLAIYVIARNPEDKLSRAFSLFVSIMAAASLLEFSSRITPLANQGLVYFFHRSSAAVWSFGFSAFLYFCLVYAEKDKIIKNPLTYLLLYAPAVGIAYMYLFTDLAVRGYVHQPYGNVSVVAPGIIFMFLQSSLFLFGGIVLLLLYSLRSRNAILVKRGLLITFGALLPSVAAIFTTIILPLYYERRWLPPSAIIGLSIFCLLTFIAIRRFSLFSLTPDQIIETILRNTSGAIVAVDVGLKISFVNRKASEILGSPSEEKLRGVYIKYFFNDEDYNLINRNLLSLDTPINSRETQITTISGEKRWIKLNGVTLKDRFETKIGIFMDFEDISEIKKAETEKERLEDEVKDYEEKLEKINQFMSGRDLEVNALKQEVNQLLKDLGKPAKYQKE